MTREEFEYLQSDRARQLIEDNLGDDPKAVALRLRDPAVATQIKNLQKCRAKLPSYYAARCIIPTVSYEQSSGEAAAFSKREQGSLAVDLTCGLGVDSYALSRQFDRVVAVEIDQLRADIARYNFERLGVDNIEVICSSAEDYVRSGSWVADLVYVDPSRRSGDGRAIYAVEQCHPNVIDMLSDMRSKSPTIVIKLSPLFDVEESFRLFGTQAHCTVLTVQNECKEVIVRISENSGANLSVIAVRDGVVRRYDFTKDQIGSTCSSIVDPQYLCVPDIGFYKSRTVSAMVGSQEHHYTGGYLFMTEVPQNFCGTVFKVREIIPYRPKLLRKRFRKATLHIRDFPYTASQIGIEAGGDEHLFFSLYCGEPTVFLVSLEQK